MSIYVDTSPPGACIAFEKNGTSLCGGYDCPKDLSEFEDSIWDVILKGGIHEDCDCMDHLRAELGFEDEEDMERAARTFRANRRLREKRKDVQHSPAHTQEYDEDEGEKEPEGLGDLFG